LTSRKLRLAGMTYRLRFKKKAKKEWDALDSTVRNQFKKKLQERKALPRVEAAKLSGMDDCYKIKLRSIGYRLVYQVRDKDLIISIVVIGKRERNHVYKLAIKRF